ncbi:MAG: hypothetical protein IKG76_06220 [Firmicutes bacterium]|nr:hypothetical protein [Bacillota bacterium]
MKKIPKVKDLNEKYARLLSDKKTAYAEYRKLRDEAQELLIAQSKRRKSKSADGMNLKKSCNVDIDNRVVT